MTSCVFCVQIKALEEKYADVQKVPEPHADLSEWWTVYDYGFDTVRKWPKHYKPVYPEDRRRERFKVEKAEFKAKRKAARDVFIANEMAGKFLFIFHMTN